MGSKWRYNVWLLGLTGGVRFLCARYLPNPGFYLTSFGGRFGTQAVFIQVIEPPATSPQYGLHVTNFFVAPKPAPPGRGFPYGFAVESDRTPY